MSESHPPDITRDDHEPLFADDPQLGRHQAYYSSNRARLLMQGGAAYVLVSIVLQLLFSGVDDETAAIFLPFLFAVAASGVLWYLTHYWNRDVTLYEHGFTYRRGSLATPIFYHEVDRFHQRAERFALFGFLRQDIYVFHLHTIHDEKMRLDNRYRHIADLGQRLEAAITRARQPIAEQRLMRGETLDFGGLMLTLEGLQTSAGDQLPWEAFQGYASEQGQLVLRADDEGASLRVPLAEIDNLLLLVALLKARQA